MSEQTNQTTEATEVKVDTEATPNAVDLNPLKSLQGDIDLMVRASLRSLCNELLRPNMKFNEKKQAIEALERAICFGFDFGTNATGANLKQHGPYFKHEQHLAALIAKFVDNTILIRTANSLVDDEPANEPAG